METIKNIWKLNTWFWKASKIYVSPWGLNDYLYAPIAWFKFMRMSIKHLETNPYE